LVYGFAPFMIIAPALGGEPLYIGVYTVRGNG
jgi:hypothetical protein